MRLRPTCFALQLFASLLTGAAAQSENPGAKPVQGAAPASPTKVEGPMANFARMVSGEWRMVIATGTSMIDTWHWGPGKHSLRVMTHGFNANAGEPWREVQAFYWHPGQKQVCLLGIEPVRRGVAEGTFQLDAETAVAAFDLHQVGGRRILSRRWVFDGPDKYHEVLLETVDARGPVPLAEWDFVRSRSLSPVRPIAAGEAIKVAERLQVLEPLLGRTWEAKGNWASGAALHVQSTFEWVPFADAIYARVVMPTKDGEPTHLLDAYVYHHTGTGAVRCLALTNRGGVYEGDLTVLDGGALQLDLQGYEGDRVVPRVVRIDFAKDGTLQQRVWSVAGAERTLLLDVQHRKSEPKQG